jgi:hypothetical protein
MISEANSTIRENTGRTRGAPKSEQLVGLLSRGEGATIAELTAAMNLLPNSARAAITGLRKKGYSVIKSTRDGATCYSLGSASK